MKKIFTGFALAAVILAGGLITWETFAGERSASRLLTELGSPQPEPFAKFRMVELPEKLSVGYAVLCVDVNGDGKKDIVVVDTTRVIWFENPTWKMHTIIAGLTKPDNVCIDAYDIDGDGKIDFALGAGWKGPAASKDNSTLQWLKRGKTLDDPWSVYSIDVEPTIHRIRFADIDGNGKKALISVPLMGRNSTAAKNWMDGAPLRVTAYRIPKDPTKDRWMPEVLDESLHVAHNFHPVEVPDAKCQSILIASYEGVNFLDQSGGKWKRASINSGNQANPNGSRGASEIKLGRFKSGTPFIVTIEPWHGNQVVVYTPPKNEKGKLGKELPIAEWDRHVIDEQLRWGHAIACVDLDGDGNDEIVIGVRDDPAKGDKFTERRGVRVYKALDDKGAKWQRQIVDNGGVAVEDLTAVDLDGDGRVDIVAVGRQTKNVRIYWNETKK